MFQWKENFQWIFSNLGSSDKVGVNESGIGIFKRQPYKGLAKEILQNVTDAKNPELPDEVPVRAKFELIYVDLEDIPGHERLREVIHKCSEYYSDGDDGEKLRSIRDAADKYFSGDTKVPVLKISDYNTTGLRGVKEETGSNWTGLVRERSATNKSNASSGAFGVGKFAPYNFTSVRTVLYSTKTINDEYAFQGKAILTTFKEDGKNKQNIGLFADKDSENFDAVFDVNDIAPVFRRTETGTDIFVLGFVKEDEDTWVEQSAISVIEYFFYSIYRGKLEVEIRDGEKRVEITQNNLGEMITFYEKYCKEHMADDTAFKFTAPSYWRLLQDSRHKIIKAPFEYNGKSMGNYELYLLTGDDVVEKKVLEMRQAGIGQKRTFDALYQNDIIKNGSSIVDVGGNDKLKEIQCDFSQSTIKLTLPADQYENYRSCGYNRSKYKMLNAILIVPALVEAIGIIAADEKDPEHQSGHQNRAWYKTIVVNLKRFAENDEKKYLQLLEKPFASAELLLGKRNVTAMAHGSKLDGEIFSEFSRDWTNLSYQAQLIRAKLQNKDISEVIDLGDIDVIPAGKYRDQMMKTRVGQYFFRMTVLNSYENRCCVTGLKQPELLVASHIKPWKVSDERTERTNPANGLCLNALHDKAFDRGLITLDKRYKIIVSRKLKDTEMDSETKSWFMGYSDHQIILPDKFLPGKDFIEYHNDVIFQR